jgi:hypothetical protein
LGVKALKIAVFLQEKKQYKNNYFLFAIWQIKEYQNLNWSWLLWWYYIQNWFSWLKYGV